MVVFFVSKFFGNSRDKINFKEITILTRKPRSHVRVSLYVVSVPPHAVRAYIVSRDLALKQFYPSWRVFTDGLTFGDEDCGLQEEN